MIIKFLGTGGVCGVPYWNCSCKVCKSKNKKDKRLRPSVFVKIANKNIVIDFGPDFRTQLLKYKIRKLDYVFLTHAHGDHINGSMELSKQPKLIFETPREVLDDFLIHHTSTKDWLEKRNPSITIQNFSKKIVNGVSIDAIKLEHKKDFASREIPCYGYVFRSKKFSFAYLSDYSKILEPEKLKDLDLIISDGAYIEPKYGHVGVEGSIEIFNEFKPKKMILTHLSHHSLHNDLSKKLKKFGNIDVAYDGLVIKG